MKANIRKKRYALIKERTMEDLASKCWLTMQTSSKINCYTFLILLSILKREQLFHPPRCEKMTFHVVIIMQLS